MEIDPILLIVSNLLAVIIGGGGAVAILSRANQSKPLKDSTEQLLYESVPTGTLKLLLQVGKGLEPAGEFLQDVTDGEPNVTTLEPPPGTPQAG